jgi:type III secretory pathway component EscR
MINIISSKNMIKDTTCLILAILCPSQSLGFSFLVISLLLVAIHTNKQIMGTNNIPPNMRINCVVIFYESRRDRRFKNH